MKKLIFAILITLTIFLFSINNADALEINYLDKALISSNTEIFDDGSYLITNVYEYNPQVSALSTTKTKTGEIKKEFYNKDTIEWTYILSATYELVEGVSVTCTSSDYSYSISKSQWKFSDGNSYYENNVAHGKGTFKYKVFGFITSTTINLDVTLTCDVYGNLS